MRYLSRTPAAQVVSPVQAGCPECRAGSSSGHLSALRERISRGDRDAFATLFDHTRGTVRAGIDARLPDPQYAVEVFTATYVEVWWLAGCRTGRDEDVLAWINRIAERRIADAREPGAPSELISGEAVDPHHLRSVRELSSLLGRPLNPSARSDLGRC